MEQIKFIPEYNKVRLDWLTFVLFDTFPDDVVHALHIPQEDIIQADKGFYGYNCGYRVKDCDIKICWNNHQPDEAHPDMGICVIVPGHSLYPFFSYLGCSDDEDYTHYIPYLLQLVDTYNGRITRCDVNIDVDLTYYHSPIKEDFCPEFFYKLWNKNQDAFITKNRKPTYITSPTGSTWYMGSRGISKNLVRIYDKSKEQGDFETHCTRFEMEIRKEFARHFLDLVVQSDLPTAFNEWVLTHFRVKSKVFDKFLKLLRETAQNRNFTQRLDDIKQPVRSWRSGLQIMIAQWRKYLRCGQSEVGSNLELYIMDMVSCDNIIDYDDWEQQIYNTE